MKFSPFILIYVSMACSFADEGITNAFDDLKRSGSISEKDSVMRVKAGDTEREVLLQEKPGENYFSFTEDRMHDIRMRDAIPARWTSRDKAGRRLFKGESAPGEFLTWQVGIFSPYQELEGLEISFSDLKGSKGDVIAADAIRCINTDGVDTDGKEFHKKLKVPQGAVQALWIGVDVPATASGTYTGKAHVKPANAKPTEIDVVLDVKGEALANHGDNEGWRKTRLKWLDSRDGLSDKPTAPYTPLKRNGMTIDYLGGSVTLSPFGLPERIVTRYDQSNQLDGKTVNDVLAGQFDFIIETDKGKEKLVPGNIEFTEQNPGTIAWRAPWKSAHFEVTCTGQFHFDGSMQYDVEVTPLSDAKVKDIRLDIPYSSQASRYMIGLGRKGGYAPDSEFKWNWDVKKHQDKVWMGNVNAGLDLVFKDANYKRPLVNVYYALGRLNMPASWGNEGKGGITISPKGKVATLLTAFSGERDIKKGEPLHYRVDMLITPVKPLDLRQMATERFYHSNSDVSANYIPEAEKAGANFINIHHKKDVYPFINYPYYDDALADLKSFIDKAHKKNIGVRAYYTTRELTIKVPELWALLSLGDEVIHDGPGEKARTITNPKGPHPWLVENLKTNFIPAWRNAFNAGKYKGEMDLSVITTPDSRWNNYYLAGLDWMVKHLGLDGVYIDDSALDRKTLQRARRILDEDGKRRNIDLHSWNHMNGAAGFANSIHLYLELLPYVDRTWIGEGFRADSPPEFWMTEIASIPYGLLSETLNAKNLYRGMVYGMLPRLPWSGNPVPMWKLWDEFGMKDAKMRGYWDDRAPVKTDNEDVLVTTYLNGNKAMVVVANWTKDEQKANILVDEKLLGFRAAKAVLPEIGNEQKEGKVDLKETQTLPGGKGLIMLLEK